MLVRSTLRMVLPAILAASILPTFTAAQSQDPESVTEAARRAREHKKAVAKPTKSFTNDNDAVKPASPSEPAATPDASAAQSGSSYDATAKDAKDTKDSNAAKAAKELADLKEQVKQAQADHDLYQRAQALQEDSFYSSPSYARDTAGKTKLEAVSQQTKDKKQALDALKAKLDAMLKTQPNSSDTPAPKP